MKALRLLAIVIALGRVVLAAFTAYFYLNMLCTQSSYNCAETIPVLNKFLWQQRDNVHCFGYAA